MAQQEQEHDRSEPATPHKLREAKRRGQVPKSAEINSLFMLGGALAILYFMGEKLIQGQLELSAAWLGGAHRVVIEGATPVGVFDELLHQLLAIYWPLLAVVVVIAAGANLLQTGGVFSFFPLKPDVQRLNPVAGLKRLFSKRMLFEAGKTLVKLFLLSVVIYLSISALLPALISLVDVNPDSYAQFLLAHAREIVFQLLLVILMVALADLAFTRWEFGANMRMSRRELKEEVKRREGDPMVRAKRRELQREAARRTGALNKVPEADVLITNPTHLAVALHYDRETMRAPTVLAKGAGDLALKMREVAYLNRVPVVENKTLARRLFRQAGIDEAVPEDLYPVVARLMAWVWMLRRQRDARSVSR